MQKLDSWIFIILLLSFIGSIAFYLSHQSIRLDEAQTISIATKPVATMLKFVAQDVHVPAYFLLIHFWIQLFGTDILLVRIPSFVFYLLTIFVLAKLTLQISTLRTTYIAISLFALSPFVMWYSFEARMYTMLTLASSLNHLFFIKLYSSNGNEAKLAYLLSAVFGLYTHYFFIFLLITQASYVVVKKWKNLSVRKDQVFGLKYFGLFFCSLAFLSPWFIYFFRLGKASYTQPLIPPPNSFNVLQTFAFFLFGFQDQVTQGALVALWPLSVMTLFLIFTQRKKLSAQFVGYFVMVTFLPIILIFTISLIRPIFLTRYLIFTIPTFFLLIAMFILRFSFRVSRLLIIVIFLLLFIFMFYQNFSSTVPIKEEYKQVSNYLNQETSPLDIILISAPFTVYPIEYYYRGSAKLETVPKWDRFDYGPIPAFDKNKIEQQLKQYQNRYEKMFLVFSYDQGYEISIKDFLDHNFERLNLIKYSPGLELRVYKLRYH